MAVNCGVGCRRDSDLVLLWLWHRLAAVATIQPLAWEPTCAVGVALKSENKNKQRPKKKKPKKPQNNAICSNLDGTRDSY